MLALVIALLMFGSSDMEEDLAQLHLETGRAYLNQGLLEQAELEFMESLDICPDLAEAILGLGLVYMERESWDLAESYLSEYTTACPNDYLGYEMLAELLLLKNAPADAAVLADSAFNKAPAISSIWLLNAEISLANADTTTSEFWLIKCLDDDAVYFEASVLLASIYNRTSRSLEARNILSPVAQADYSPALWGLAKIYLEWNDYQRAVTAINRYLYLTPTGIHADSCRIVLDDLAESGRYIPEN